MKITSERPPTSARVLVNYAVAGGAVGIYILDTGGELRYHVCEPRLTREEQSELDELIRLLKFGMNPPPLGGATIEFVQSEIARISFETGQHRMLTSKAMEYYILRELSYKELYPLVQDDHIEDIKVVGYKKPVFVVHRKYGHMRTNIRLEEKETDDLAQALAHLADTTISIGRPVEDAILPDGSRLNITLGQEVSREGTTIAIRKFKRERLSAIDLLNLGTISPLAMAYLMLIAEHKKSILIYGPTGSGKTTLLNAVVSLLPPSRFFITMEDTPEIHLHHEARESLVTRKSFYFDRAGEITLCDLLKTAMRKRPDYLIVGEVLGEEAYVLFQAISTGHGGVCTMHGESIERVVRRLTTKPMNVPREHIDSINTFVEVKEIMGGKRARRVTAIYEALPGGKFEKLFEYRADKDALLPTTIDTVLRKSYLLRSIASFYKWREEKLKESLAKRVRFLEGLMKAGITKPIDVHNELIKFYRS